MGGHTSQKLFAGADDLPLLENDELHEAARLLPQCAERKFPVFNSVVDREETFRNQREQDENNKEAVQRAWSPKHCTYLAYSPIHRVKAEFQKSRGPTGTFMKHFIIAFMLRPTLALTSFVRGL